MTNAEVTEISMELGELLLTTFKSYYFIKSDEISARPATIYFAIAYFLRELMESFENPKTLEEIEALLKSLTDTSLEFIKQVREDNK